MKSNWKVLLAAVLIVILASSLLVACGGSKKDATAESQVIKLKFSHHNPPTAFVCKQGFEPWAKAIEQKTGGKVKIDIYPSSTLNKPQDAYDAVVKGIADITWGFVAYYPGRFPLTEVLNLPMLGVDKASLGSKVIWDLYTTTPYLQKEFADVKVLTMHTHDGAPITSRMPILNASDMAGKKLRTGGGPVVNFLQSFGSSPIAMPAPDTYQAAEKGVVDGAVMAWEAVEMLNMQEVVKNGLDANVHSGTFFLIMNKQKWESLPPEVKKVLEDESGDAASQLFAKAWDATKTTSTDKFKKAGGVIQTLSPEEQKVWQEKAKLVWDKWANDLEAKGLPGKAVLEETLKRVEKYKK